MTEVFKPRENMVNKFTNFWCCFDEDGNHICDGGPSIIGNENFWEFYITSIGYHRLDGPANSDGQWFIHGKNVTGEIHRFAKENNINLKNLTDEDKAIIALKFG